MVTRIPTNQEQDEEEFRRKCTQFQILFNWRRDMAIRNRRYTSYREMMLEDLMEVRKTWTSVYPTNPELEESWKLRFESFAFDNVQILPLSQAKVQFPRACMLLAMENDLPYKFPKLWGWVANHEVCPLPMDDYIRENRIQVD